jgi:hypothetical protein
MLCNRENRPKRCRHLLGHSMFFSLFHIIFLLLSRFFRCYSSYWGQQQDMGRRQEGHASTPNCYRDCPHDTKHNDNNHEGDDHDGDRDMDRDGERHSEEVDSSQGRQEQDQPPPG